MKRVGNIYDKVYDFNNLYNAFLKAKDGKEDRPEVLRYIFNVEENLINLQNHLIWGTYQQGKYREHYIYEPKKRLIKALPFNDRVLQHALNNIIEPLFTKRMYYCSYACREGKGLHRASKIVTQWLYNAKAAGQQLFCLKCDIKQYFNSVVLMILYKIINRKIKDKKALWLIRHILNLKNTLKGLPIGNLTSQLFANVYLNELDDFIKEKLKIKKYIRYMDDFLLFSESKEELHDCLKKIESFLKRVLNLELNSKTRIFPVRLGVEFVGFVHYAEYTKIRKSTWKRSKKKLKTAVRQFENGKISEKVFYNKFSAVIGSLKHVNAKDTLKNVLEYRNKIIEKERMKKMEACKMKIKDIAAKIEPEKVMDIIARNEIDGLLNIAYRFSKAGGKSGYSFGRSQFDVSNNPSVSQFLRNKCGFTAEDINTLLRLEKDVTGLNNKLREHKKEIDDYDLQHIKNMIKYVGGILSDLDVENEETFVHLVDYHNQFNLSKNGKMHRYLQTLKFATSENVLNFKLNQTKWGKEHPHDVKRRYNNIKNYYQKEVKQNE